MRADHIERIATQLAEAIKRDGPPGLREQADCLVLRIDWAIGTGTQGDASAPIEATTTQVDRKYGSKRVSRSPNRTAPAQCYAFEPPRDEASAQQLEALTSETIELMRAGMAMGEARIGMKPLLRLASGLLHVTAGITGALVAEAMTPLIQALDELDQGTTHLMFAPAHRRGGRPRDHARIRGFKLRCILLANAMVANGVPASTANVEVASCASAMADRLFGARPSYSFDAETVRRWRKGFAARRKADAGSGGERTFSEEEAAVMAYDLAKFKGKLPEYARALRKSLEPANFEMPVGWSE